MTTEELEKLIAQGETAKVDFKRQWYKDSTKNQLKNEFVKDILALTNGDIHSIKKTAYLIIGITDDTRQAYPFDDASIPRSLEKLSQQLLDIINNYAQPEFLNLKAEWVEYQETEVLVLSVLPHGRLISLAKDLQLAKGTDKKGTVYYRIGESIRVASADVVRDFEKAFAKGNTEKSVSITVHGGVKGVVNAGSGSVINQTIS